MYVTMKEVIQDDRRRWQHLQPLAFMLSPLVHSPPVSQITFISDKSHILNFLH